MEHLSQLLPEGTKAKDVVFVCVGTDRSTGDSLGPMVGTALKKKRYNVFGTLEEPVHAMNLKETLEKLPKDKVIIGIDACLGRVSSVGDVRVAVGPLKPGAGVGKELPEVGDYNIHGIVNVGGFMEYFVLQNTRLYLVMRMSDSIVKMVTEALPKRRKKANGKVDHNKPNRLAEPQFLVLQQTGATVPRD